MQVISEVLIMDVVESVNELLNADWKLVIISLVILVVALVVIKEFYMKFIKLFNIETSSMKKEREHKKEMEQINKQLEQLQTKQHELSEKSNAADEKMERQISDLSVLLKSLTVASMRSTLWRIHTESTERQYITQEGLKTFIECGKVYESAGGDDIYHDKLYPDIMVLPVHTMDGDGKSSNDK